MSASKSAKPNKQHGNANPARPSSSASNRRDQVYDTFNVALDVTANIAEGSDILAPLKAVCRATKSILEVMQAIESNKEEWADLTRRLTEYISTFEEQITLLESYPQSGRPISKAFTRHLERYVELLKDIHSTVVNLREKRSRSKLSLLTGFSKFKIDVEEIRKFNRDIEDRHRQLMSALSIFIAAHVQALERNADASTILQLPTVAFIASSVHRTCLNGTREAVLQMIGRWANDTTSEKPIFWLCDIAGSGKSTVAMSAVETWQKEGVLGGRFFFSMASSEGSTTDKFCSTIARDLVHYIPELTPHVAESMKQNPAFMRSSLEEQFRTLVTGPLHHRQQHVILVIDAVDECKSGSHRKEILEVLSGAVRENKNLKILMTSRPDPIIEEVLGPLSIKSKMEGRLHDSSHRDNVNDIAVYVHGSLGEVLSEDKKQKLVEKANGLFIWASTACRLLTSKTSFSSPEDTYDRLISMEQTGAIDDVYDLVLERTDPEHRSVMCTMLALLLAAFEPLTLDDLNDILKHNRMRGSAKALVQNLGSILASDATTNLIQFRHPTIVEYLRRRSIAPSVGSNKVHVNITNAHGQAASWCLNRLKLPTEGLKFNICQIESSFYLNRQIPDLDARISKSIPRRLRYASFHWLFHVAETNEKGRSMLRKELQHAIQVPRVFYWMEVLSLTGGVSRAIDGLRALTRHAGKA
ncbi:related to vegetative incompatibility protein HET-E-1-Pyrenophora tritici-repentis [Serendipita indica DSM 11827]|uniref:Related to vegetative incompatibility protein HET-E-1-Pyrenophora tritici-repentis n=1 Tax=Serendipita indica (strain DSM 11827) TaxID=1109443 RepID=G4TRE4_SERID|nr:related to vegetative incompatibility protein HET-E-1-Pyrenophora tritici-repentis [Serendipita indica DSM 11827]